MSAHVETNRGEKKLFVFAIAVVVLAALAWWMKNHVSLEELVAHESRLRERITLQPWWSFVVGLGIYAVVSLIPGTSGKSVIFGWLFGFWQGVVLVLLGLTAAAMSSFSLSRYVFRDHIERRYGSFLALLNKHLDKEGAFYLLTLRMAHAPYSIINLGSGASRVGSWTFCWTTMLGLLPGTAVFVYAGINLPSLRELSSQGAGSLVDPRLIGALALSATLPFLFRWCVSHFGIPGDRGRGSRGTVDHQPEPLNR